MISRIAKLFPYAVIRWYIKNVVPERGTLIVENGPKNKGKFWEICPNEVIFVGDREAYLKKIAKLEQVKQRLERELEKLDEGDESENVSLG
jgi:hypothetical protein